MVPEAPLEKLEGMHSIASYSVHSKHRMQTHIAYQLSCSCISCFGTASPLPSQQKKSRKILSDLTGSVGSYKNGQDPICTNKILQELIKIL